MEYTQEERIKLSLDSNNDLVLKENKHQAQ